MSEHQDWKDRFDGASAHGDKGEEESGGCGCAGQSSAEAAAENKGCGDRPCMPKPTFSTFVLSLASSALVQLGEVPDPSTGEKSEDHVMAKHTIDILSILQDKIKNGLDAEETRLLEGLLYELRMKFVMKK
jgi:hypothetical protein